MTIEAELLKKMETGGNCPKCNAHCFQSTSQEIHDEMYVRLKCHSCDFAVMRRYKLIRSKIIKNTGVSDDLIVNTREFESAVKEIRLEDKDAS